MHVSENKIIKKVRVGDLPHESELYNFRIFSLEIMLKDNWYKMHRFQMQEVVIKYKHRLFH